MVKDDNYYKKQVMQILSGIGIITLLLIVYLFTSPSMENDPFAITTKKEGKVTILLTGVRPLMYHMPVPPRLVPLANDSIRFTLIKAEGIVHQKYTKYYPFKDDYSSSIRIWDDELTVKLSGYYKKWNGTYEIKWQQASH